MSEPESESNGVGGRTGRRDLIKKAAIGGAVVWAVPTVLSTEAAFAAGSPPASGILSVTMVETGTCDPTNLSLDVTTVVTPDLVGKYLRYFFTWTGGNSFDSCLSYGLSFPISSTTSQQVWSGNLGTVNVGVAMSVTNDCVDTVASFPAVPSTCGPLPSAVQPNAADAATASASGAHPVPVFK